VKAKAGNHRVNQSVDDAMYSSRKSVLETLRGVKSLKEISRDEFNSVKKSFEFPINPAFFHSGGGMIKVKRLKCLTDYCKEKHVGFNKSEDMIIGMSKAKEGYKHWTSGIQKMYVGGDQDDADKFIERLK
jgi:hypothetical protein